MALELPIVSAFIARLQHPEINLAAYGGIVMPISLIIEAPVVMYLAASTALTTDWQRYKTFRQYTLVSGLLLSGFHFLIAITPLYFFVTETLIGAPEEIIGPARIGLILMTPWTGAIAYRRFKQGILIRYERSKLVGIGTVVRLMAMISILVSMYYFTEYTGVVIAATAMALGTVIEALFIKLVTNPIVQENLVEKTTDDSPLTLGRFVSFYYPLALTTIFTFFAQPLGSAAMSRMPNSVKSLAIWPVMFGLLFILRSSGIAYKEVVVSLFNQERSYPGLKRFTWILTVITTAAIVLMILTPLSETYFQGIEGLSKPLTQLAGQSLWYALLIPGLAVVVNWYQGILVAENETRAIIESVIIFLVILGITLGAGIALRTLPGIYVTLLSFTAGWLAQTFWLKIRSRPFIPEHS